MEERGYKRKHSDVTWFVDVKLIRYAHDFVDSEGHPVKIDQNGKKAEAADAGDVEF
jgi:putative DNA primase/helicase